MSRTNRLLTAAGIAEVHAKPPAHCHRMVRDTARGMCAAFYETAAKDDLFYKQWPSQAAFVERKWGCFVGQARATLAGMLGMSDDRVIPMVKEAIYEALQRNAAAMGGNIQVLH